MALLRNLLMAFYFISFVVADHVRRELTTRSWDAIGFSQGVKRSKMEENIIIGIVDTGIWPEAPCFNDKGLGPPPAKWKGICQPNDFNFTCNNKIIGAIFYVPDPRTGFNITAHDEESPRDHEGHGTHVAATAAGVPVPGISVNDIGLGTARGALPNARIAVYKTCWLINGKEAGCFNVDQAIDDAVKDGVDIISASIGGLFAMPYYKDFTAIACFNAMRHGVFVSFAAGNAGPKRFLMDNISPWVLTVGNSHAGPEIATPIKLGNGKTIKGQLKPKSSHTTLYPLVPSWEVSKKKNDSVMSMICSPESLDRELIKGKIILCPSLGGHFIRESIAAGFIFDVGDMYDVMREHQHRDDKGRNTTYVAVSSEDFKYMVEYYHESASSSNGTATASILQTTEMMNNSPPTVAYSSSRGPNIIDPTIMKPDISAPGVNIIAAIDGNSTYGSYDSYTGTSMATPHASGIAGYVKAFNPSWSPAAIKSALLTSASPMATDKHNKVYELAYGAGMLNPLAAVDPGLVYNLTVDDYIKYVCQWAGNNNPSHVQHITRDPNVNCSNMIKFGNNWSLNLPTFSVPAKPNTSFVKVFTRRVTNVGLDISNYKAIVSEPKGVKIQLQPNVLSFTEMNQELMFTVTIKGVIPDNETVVSAAFAWTDGHHHVRSPIVIHPEFDKDAELKKLLDDMYGNSEQNNAGGTHIV